MVMWYDVLMLGILLFFAFRGATRGFVFQLASLAGIVLCFVFADAISHAAGPYVHLEPPLNHWVVMFASYLGFSFVCFGIARVLHGWMERQKLTDFDRHLGVLFGAVKGVLLILVLTFFVVTVSESARASLKSSLTGRYAAILMDRLHPILPQKMHDAVAQYIHLLDNPDLDLRHSHDHGHDHDGDIHLHADQSNDSVLGTPGTIPQTPSQTGESGSLWAGFQNLFNQQAQRVVSDAMQQADPQSREELERQLHTLIQSIPQEDRAALQQQIVQVGASQLQQYLDWQLKSLAQPAGTSSSPLTNAPVSKSPAPVSTTPENANRQQALIQEIAAIYSTVPSVRQNIVIDINRRIAGVPEQVCLAVLMDWRSDLLGSKPDPDPTTAPESSIEARIIRQLQVSGVQVEELSPDVQQRLRTSQAQGSRVGNPI